MKPADINRQLLSTEVDGEHVPVLRLRNTKQIYNAVTTNNLAKRFSRDEIYNTMMLAYNLDDYIYEITTFPDLCVILE